MESGKFITMETRTTFPNTLVAFLTLLIMTACGGGSGEDNSNNVDVPSADINITSGNAKPVSATVLNSLNLVKGPSYVAGIFTGTSMKTTGGIGFNHPDSIAYQQTNFRSHDSLSGRILQAISSPETSSCPISGSASKTGSIANDTALTTGDTLTFTYSSCNDGKVTISGSMAMTFSQVNPSSPYPLGMDVVQKHFSVTADNLTITRNGDISVLLDKNESGDKKQQISGRTFSVSSGNQEEMLANYLYDIQSTSLGDISISLQGRLSSTKIGGSVSYTSVTPFSGKDNLYSGNTVAGKLHITTSADNSQAWLIALSDGINIQIDIDTDGNDLVDATVMTTWSELQHL